MTRYTLTVPVAYTKDGKEQTTFRRVGSIFENQHRNSDATFLSIRLDYPVAVTEFVAFPATNGTEDEVVTD